MTLFTSMLSFALITLLGVLGTFLLTGLTGLFSFGQASFMALGAYISGLAVIKFNVPFPLAIIIGVASGTLCALIIGIPTLRLNRDFFSLITFGFGEAVAGLLNYFVNVTGGAMGLSGIPPKTNLLMVALSTGAVIWMVNNFRRLKFGRQCLALKNDELAAAAVGIDVYRIKLQVFIISAIITSYAGALYGFLTSYVEPAMFGWTKSAEWVIMVFFGGVNSLTGAVVAGFLLNILPEVLRFASEWRIAAYCLIIVVLLNFRPTGLFDEYELSFRRKH
ncbi:Branched-chain amino acid transport system / permease component [Neomoorella glycerini]|uniref:Branched-chain amino acid transport system / permease component n=1 Tax=Neomoorella glycerini TaxID=55779 RepID=A0A6I5ZQH7_9FIRM|nr:branched-chain amino acid ABC transporter permease [Moorella glycerini]QGP92048.1 Branched-chain amino acid transport system / permease component [Moorella glycerini]